MYSESQFLRNQIGVYENMKKTRKLSGMLLLVTMSVTSVMAAPATTSQFPEAIKLSNVAQNPEGIEYDKRDHTFLLSSLNAAPVLKVNFDGTFKPFTKGEKFPLSTAGLQIDYKHNRLLVAGFNGMALMDKKPETKGTAHLRIYDLDTGAIEKDINLSAIAPADSEAFFANDIAVDLQGNAYISDWYANVIYKVSLDGKPSLFWENKTTVSGGPNGLDYHPDGYLLVSLLSVDQKGLYSNYGLVKVPVDRPDSAKLVDINEPGFTGFDGMVINQQGHVVGITNNAKEPGGNMLLELSGNKDWESAVIENTKGITKSTTVAITPENKKYVINQDFSNSSSLEWVIESVGF